MKLPGVILAAGLSSRMGRPKALLPLEESSFVERLIATLSSECDPVIVVLGAAAEDIAVRLPPTPGLRVTVNADYEAGMLSSLQTGLRVTPADAPGVLFTLVDHPRLRPQTLAALLEAFSQGGCAAVIPRYQGERGHPVVISRALVDELLDLPSDASPKDVMRKHREATVFVDVDDPAIIEDIDTPEDYAGLRGGA